MVNWIGLGDINKYMFFPFGGGILSIIFTIIIGQMKSNLRRHPLLRGMNSGIGMAVAFIPYLIIYKRSQKISKDITSKNEAYINMLEEERKKLKKNKYLLLFICSFFEFLQKYLSFAIIHNEQSNAWIFDLIYFTVFSRFILNQKLYRHQYLSLAVIIVILLISVFVYDLDDIKEKNGMYFMLSLYIEFVYSVNYVLNKYLMESKFCSPFEICSFEGLFIIIFNAILISIVTFIEIPKYSGALKVFNHLEYEGKIYIDNIKDYIESFDANEFFSFVVNIIYKVIFNLCCLLTINYFTPAHVIIILFFGEMESFIRAMWKGNVFLTFIVFILLLFFILVFTEIIELNFLGISENTKKNIRERVLKEKNVDDDDDSNICRIDSAGDGKVELNDGVIVELSNQPSFIEDDLNIH